MATVVKDFKVKAGLIVEGSTAKVNNFDILTKSTADQNYIISLVTGGGGSDSDNTPNTVVLRDENGSFAAGTITAETKLVSDRVEIGSIGVIRDDDGDLVISTTNDGDDVMIDADDIRLNAIDDVLITSGNEGSSAGDIVLTTNGGDIRLQAADVFLGTNINYTDAERVATRGYVDDAIDNIDLVFNTDEIAEGSTNLYYTDARARAAVDAGDGLDYNSSTGVFSADLGYGLQFDVDGQISVDGTVIATDQDMANAIEDHSDLTTGVHGVTGSVVGTSDVQELTNKTLGSGTVLSANLDADGFTVSGLGTPINASDAATKGYVDAVAEGLHIHASVAAATSGNIVLAPAPAAIDNVTLTSGMRVLVKSQTNTAENGIYEFDGTNLVRAEDYDTAAEIQAGDFVFVSGGDTYAATGWVQENPVTTLGTDPIVWDQFSGAGEYTAGNGLDLNGTEFSIDETVTATRTYVDGEIDAHELLTTGIHGVTGDIVGTSDSQTLTNKTIGSGTSLSANLDAANTAKIVNLVDPTSAQDAATKKYVDDEISGVNTTINNLTTTDIAEGTNEYFTDARAKSSAASLLTTASLTNITITGDGTGLTITAENGVADSTTDDLAEGTTNLYYTDARVEAVIANTDTDDIDEGTTNLYFTDARAVSALEAVVPNFTEIDINSVATQVAATQAVATASQVVGYSFDSTEYRSAKFLVKVKNATHSEVSEVLVTLDGSNNIAITEYAVVGTNGSMSTITAGMSGDDVQLLVTTANNNSDVTVMGTLLV